VGSAVAGGVGSGVIGGVGLGVGDNSDSVMVGGKGVKGGGSGSSRRRYGLSSMFPQAQYGGSMYARHEKQGLPLGTEQGLGARLLGWCTALCESPEWRIVFQRAFSANPVTRHALRSTPRVEGSQIIAGVGEGSVGGMLAFEGIASTGATKLDS
ncbi:unnamed protein product, partial [Choristocarpus tenellus]